MPSSERRHRPPHWGWIATAIVVIAAVVVLGVVHARSRSDPRPSGSSTTTSAPAPVSSSPTPPPKSALPVGITFGGALFDLTRAQVDDALDDVVALHMTWIRVDFSWAAVQPRSSEYVRVGARWTRSWRPPVRIICTYSGC